MEILIFNTVVGTTNIGDAIIFNSCEKALESLLDKAYVMELATHLKNYGLEQYIKKTAKVKFAENCDFKFIFGTNLLTSNYVRSIRQWPVGPLDRNVYKNCIMMGVGTTYGDKKADFLTKKLYKNILRKDIVHSVRDEESKAFLESVPNIRAINTGCPTLWGFTSDVCEKIPQNKAKNVITSVSGYKDQKNPDKDRQMLNTLKKNYDVIYFWAQTSVDEGYLREIAPDLDVKVIHGLRQYKDICHNEDVDYIGTRLHGGIYAMQNGVRSLIVGIDHRARGFHNVNNLNVIPREDIQQLEDIIHSNIITDIRLKINEIHNWLGQFDL